jgi:hypothetical protein
MIENEKEMIPYSHYPPQPQATSSDEEETMTQPTSAEPLPQVATAAHQLEQPLSIQPEVEPTVTIAPVPASTLSPQPENNIQATVAPALPHMSIDDLLALKIVSDRGHFLTRKNRTFRAEVVSVVLEIVPLSS